MLYQVETSLQMQAFVLMKLQNLRLPFLKTFYSPASNFCGFSLDNTDHVIQNRTRVVRRYNKPNNFCELSLDKIDHVDDGYQRISAVRFDIHRLILLRQKENQETSKRSR